MANELAQAIFCCRAHERSPPFANAARVVGDHRRQNGSSRESGDATAAEIVAVSEDGLTLIYSNSPKREICFVDNIVGTVAYDAGNPMELLMARIGHYNDKRSDAKGNGPENAEFARFDGPDYLFIASERLSVVPVYAISNRSLLVFKQALPAALSTEGLLAIASRNLLIAAGELESRADLVRYA